MNLFSFLRIKENNDSFELIHKTVSQFKELKMKKLQTLI